MEDIADRERSRGFLQERLWVVLTPLLLTLSLIFAIWSSNMLRHERDVMRHAEAEARLQSLIEGASSDVGLAIESTNRTRMRFLVDALASVSGGRVVFYHGSGGLLVSSDKDRREDTTLTKAKIAEELLVWGPATGLGATKVGEIRVHAPLPSPAPFPWAYFATLFAACALLAGLVLFAVARCIAPVRKLGSLFTRLGESGPDAVVVPGERFAEFGQVRNEILDCLDRLKERQLRAEESFVEVALSLAREYEYHREGTIGHAQRVRRYVSWVADRLRLPPKERDAVEVAALCHDLGKLPAMPIEGVGEVAQLITEAAEQVDTVHPVLGAAFFEAMPGLEDVATIVVAHHENWDGTGFPKQLAGEEIPLGARLLRIADAFERAYAKAASDESSQEVLEALSEEKGTAFDPFLFEIFREEVAVHLLEKRRLQVTLQAYKQKKDALASSS